ncbi:MAG: zinc-binding dehydrogenase [Oscillospiraceae bacterium]|nr:zinc-binding dehydrogenase [Oscillospiraceae bacterium]
MKALFKYAEGPGNLEVRDVPVPEPGPGQVRIKIAEAGICGSDLHIYHSDIAIPVKPPVIIGHEFSGVVDALGEGVSTCAIGDRVVSETAFSYCGACELCRTGWYNLCPERRTLGYWYDGAFANYTVVPEGRVHAIPDSVSFTSAAMTEPLACVTHAIGDLCKISPQDVVLVTGPGAIGLMAAQTAKAYGATVVLSGAGVDEERLALGRSLGIDHTINIGEEDLGQALDTLTGGAGPDVVLECSGAPAAINTALRLVKKRGWFVQIGLPGKPIQFDLEAINYREIRFSGSLGSRRQSWRMALSLQEAGKVRLEPLVTHKYPVSEWKEAFDVFENKQGCKVFILPVDI